jgi:hypothetical protein
VGHCENG